MREPSKSLQPAKTASAISQVGAALLFLLIVLPSFALPQESRHSQPRPDNHDKHDAIKIYIDLVVLHASVQDRKSIPVSGLGKEDFQVYEDGVLQQIDFFNHEDIPVTVGLVIDNSGSMRPKRTEVIAAALAFARASNKKDQIFVVNFNEHVSFSLPANTPFTDKPAQLEFALSKIAADGMTALYDAVAAALEHLKWGNRDKQVLIVISDGADNASRHNLASLMALARHSEAIIYTIGLYDRDDPDRNPGSLKQLAKATGGEAFFPESVKDVLPICDRIARDIRNQYTLSYTPTNTRYDGKYRVIEVKAKAPGRDRLMVRTRAGYYAPLKP
ncbi:MAG TPA: VWA domain-containing protein [Pyrinomonadaceae bacterium]|nr:VWA domain-containing protein [Pyrinomonadaceae bacterium]